MLKSLYSKMLAWLLLNLLLIALVGGGFVFFVLFSNTYGLVPASLFSSNVENVFRVLSTELQYRSTQEWSAIVKAYDRPGLQFHLVSLDDPWLYFAGDFVPLAILETAQRIPRTPFTLCPDPSKVFRGSEDYQTETGLAPTPPAIFARQGSPTGYCTPGPSLSPTPTMRPITCCWRWNPTTSPGRGFSSTSGWRCLWRSGSSACPACGGPLSSGTLRGPSWAWPTMPNASPPRGIRAASRPCPSMPRGRMR